MPYAAVFQRRQDFIVPNPIPVYLSFGREAGMEGFRHKPALHDSDRRRKDAIQRRPPPLRPVTPGRNIHVGALGESVDARIRAAGPVHSHRLGTNLLKGFLEVILNAVAIRLTLPAGERRAVIPDY